MSQIPFANNPYPARDAAMSNTYWNIETKRQSASNLTPGNAVGATNKDFRVMGTAEAPWDAVRIHILNAETSNSVQGVTANFAPTSTTAGFPTPTGSWTTFTWAAAGSINLVDSSSNQLFNVVTSDWMSSANVQSVARTDGGALPLFMITVHNPTGAGAYTYTFEGQGSTAFDTDALTRGRLWFKAFQSNIDGVGTPANFTQTVESNNINPMIVQFRSRGRVLSYMASGDSIQGGSLTTSNMLSPGFRMAIANSTATLPIQYMGSGWASQTSANYLANAKTLITAAQPQVCSYAVYSPNDSAPSAAQNQIWMRQAIDFTQHCRANNCIPILLGPTPINTDSASATSFKLALNNTLLALRARGFFVVDYWSRVAQTSAAGIGTWRPGYTDDPLLIHPNDAGAAVMAQALWEDALQYIAAANT